MSSKNTMANKHTPSKADIERKLQELSQHTISKKEVVIQLDKNISKDLHNATGATGATGANGSGHMFEHKMDTKNLAALDVLMKEGDAGFVKHVFTGDEGEKLTYAQMRDLYG